VLFGAVGDAKYDSLPREKRPEQSILKLRKELDLFANLRPASVFPELADASTLRSDVVAGLDLLILARADRRYLLRPAARHPHRPRRPGRLRHHALLRAGDPDIPALRGHDLAP